MNRNFVRGFLAAGEIGAKLAVIAKDPDGADLCASVADSKGIVIGINGIESKKKGETADITLSGIAPVIAGADLAAGDGVKANEKGEAIKASTGDLCFGVALTSTSQGGEVSVLIRSITL